MSENSAAFAALDDMIARCRSLPNLAKEGAPAVAAKLQELMTASNAAGTTPEGEGWAATKDGRQPLQGAMGAIKVQTIGTRIIVTLSGYHVFHQRGTKSLPERRMIPSMLDAKMGAAIREIYAQRFAAKMGGS